MNPGADVRSLDALKDWYAALAEFKEGAGNALTTVVLAIQREADWVADQQQQWRRELRRAEDEVTRCRNELRTRELDSLFGDKPDTTVQQKALAKAVARMHFVEERIDACRRWQQRLPKIVQDTYEGPSRAFGSFLEIEFSRAQAALGRQIDALDQYVGVPPARTAAADSPPPATETKEPPQ
jgi:hypothetical protein